LATDIFACIAPPTSRAAASIQGLYEATRRASVSAPTWTPMVRALLMRGRRFIASAPFSFSCDSRSK